MARFALQPASTAAGAVTLLAADGRVHSDDFAGDVRAGLTASPKRLSCRYFYDEAGSKLFEEICRLPEYYLTRAEHAILEERAGEIAALFTGGATLVELGSGSAVKTRLLIRALIERQGSLRFIPVDISRSALEESSAALTEEFDNLEILAVAGEYGDGLEYLRQHPGGRRLILWLGSNVGNFERAEAAEFIAGVRAAMSPEDRFLAGIDLRKDRAVLEAAYDDSEGVTARFNRNILERVNRDLGGRFDLGRFRHRAVWDEELGRVEMHLESVGAQTIPIEGLELEVGFADGETIHTENSYKYSTAEIEALAAAAGMTLERQWFDYGGRLSVNLFRP